MLLLGNFNASVSKASEIDDVIGMFGQETSNNNGEKLVSFLTEVDLVSCNGRTLRRNQNGLASTLASDKGL